MEPEPSLGAASPSAPETAAAAAAPQTFSFKDRSTYRADPRYTASGVRSYVNDQLYPHLLTAMQAVNTVKPERPLQFMARCLLEGQIPEDEPVGAPPPRHVWRTSELTPSRFWKGTAAGNGAPSPRPRGARPECAAPFRVADAD